MTRYEDRPAPDEYAPSFGPYVDRVPAGDLIELLERQAVEMRRLLEGLTESQATYAYAPGKWTIKEVVGHLSDAERVFAYRALRFARGDATELAGFEEDAYVAAGAFGARPLADLLDEFAAARSATVKLLVGLPPEAWLRRGVANGYATSVRALACIIAGHELHHRAILVERYGVPTPTRQAQGLAPSV